METTQTRQKKMKLATVLAATASANVSSYIAEHWWNEAVNVFNFANSNWDQFAAAANSVDDSQWKPLWTFCNANGDGEILSDELTSCAASRQLRRYVRKHPRLPLQLRCQILERCRSR